MWRTILCVLGLHRPSVHSVARRGEQYVGLCDNCATPLVMSPDQKWQAADPL